MKRITQLSLLLAVAIFAFSSCKEKDEPTYEVPDTYNFANVYYGGQTERLNMLEEMSAYMESAENPGTILDVQRLKDMFANQNTPFSFSSTKQLKDKCFSLDVAMVESWLDSVAVASQSAVAGSPGVAGVVQSAGGSKYLLSANGIDYDELIVKGLMGAVFYYQATAVYLSDDKIGAAVDNTNITPGEGTDMEHHWDEAFGYLGVPINFPANTANARFFGEYCAERDALLATNSVLMTAFLTGRAAISGKDMDTKNAQIPIIRDTWERVIAGTILHYLNAAKTNFADDALRCHQLSEARGFTLALRYNPTKKITDTNWQSALDLIGENFYTITLTNIDGARDVISTAYGLDALKDQL
jgi:hypothetical protein